MMEYNSYSFNNEQFRVKKIKDKIIKTDFAYYKRLVNRINKFKESLIEEDNENGAPVKKCKLEIDSNGVIVNYKSGDSNDNNEKTDNKNINDTNDDPSFIDYLKAEFESGLFNLKGKLKKMTKQEINNIFIDNFSKAKFNVNLVMKDLDAKYTINLVRIENSLFEKFDKLPKDTIVSFLKMKTLIEKGQIIFRQCDKSEIVFENNCFHDLEKPLVMNHLTRKYYDAEKRKLKEKKNLEKSRFPLNGLNGGSFREPINYFIDLNGAEKNEHYNMMNDQSKINDYLTLAETFPDFTDLLTKDVEHSIYGMTNVMRINSTQAKKDVFGIVKSYKAEEKLETIELISLKDSNVIKVLHYNKNVNLKLRENMIISIKSISLKVNKNFDIYLENPDPSSITIYDKLNEEDANKFKRFRCNKYMEFGCIIELTKPVLIRTIQKYLITIKKIFKIMAIHEKDSYVISGFPDLKLIAKCLVDDGSFEAQVYMHDHNVVNLFKLDKETLNKINQLSQNSCNVVIYEKFNQYKVLHKENLDNIFIKQLIIYCVPFSNVAKKHFYDNNYNRYFENLGQINNLKNKALNLAFINGDILFDKIHGNFLTLLPRPFLRVMHLENIE